MQMLQHLLLVVLVLIVHSELGGSDGMHKLCYLRVMRSLALFFAQAGVGLGA